MLIPGKTCQFKIRKTQKTKKMTSTKIQNTNSKLMLSSERLKSWTDGDVRYCRQHQVVAAFEQV